MSWVSNVPPREIALCLRSAHWQSASSLTPTITITIIVAITVIAAITVVVAISAATAAPVIVTIAASTAASIAATITIPRITTLEAGVLGAKDHGAALWAVPISWLATALATALTTAAVGSTATAATAATATASARTSTSSSSSGDLHVDGAIFALAIVIADSELHLVTVTNAAVAIQKTRSVAKDVVTTIIRFDEAEAFLFVPSLHNTRWHGCKVMTRSLDRELYEVYTT